MPTDTTPTDDVTIRPATPADGPVISALVDALAHYFLADPDDRAAAATFFASIDLAATTRNLGDRRYRYHVAERGGEVVGVVATRDRTHLFHLFVAEPAHRRGLGRRLWEVARRGEEGDGPPLRFTVNASIPAVDFYRRLGFVPTAPLTVMHGVAFVPMVREVTGVTTAP